MVTTHGDAFVASLDGPARTQLSALGRVRRHRVGAVLFHEGDRSTNVLVIRSGRVKVTTTTSEGHELVLAIRGPTELVGELAALDLDVRRRSATVVALSPVEVGVVTNDEFLRFLEDHPRALMTLTRTVIGHLHDADRRRAEFGAHDTLGRLAHVLDELTTSTGRPTESGIQLDPALTQSELAGLVCASRESVVRALGELRRRGLVETGRRRLIVLDPAGLADLRS